MGKKSALIGISYLFLLFCFLSVSAQKKAAEESKLIEKQKSYFEAIKTQNYEFLNDNLAEKYIGAYALGIIDKNKEISDLKAFKLVDYEINQFKVNFPNKKTGIIAFKIRVKALVNEKAIFEDDVITCVWILQNKKWVLLSQSAAKICS